MENQFPLIKNKRVASLSLEKNNNFKNKALITRQSEKSISKEDFDINESTKLIQLARRKSTVLLPILGNTHKQSTPNSKKSSEIRTRILKEKIEVIDENSESQKVNYSDDFSRLQKLFPNNYSISNIIDNSNLNCNPLVNTNNTYTVL